MTQPARYAEDESLSVLHGDRNQGGTAEYMLRPYCVGMELFLRVRIEKGRQFQKQAVGCMHKCLLLKLPMRRKPRVSESDSFLKLPWSIRPLKTNNQER